MTLLCLQLWFYDAYAGLKRLFNVKVEDGLNDDKCLADYEYKKGDSFGLLSAHIRHIANNNFNV